jgi:hypothetical protein
VKKDSRNEKSDNHFDKVNVGMVHKPCARPSACPNKRHISGLPPEPSRSAYSKKVLRSAIKAPVITTTSM